MCEYIYERCFSFNFFSFKKDIFNYHLLYIYSYSVQIKPQLSKPNQKKMFAWLSNGTMCGGCVANLFRRINTEETYIEAQFINVLAISVRIHYVC